MMFEPRWTCRGLEVYREKTPVAVNWNNTTNIAHAQQYNALINNKAVSSLSI